MKISFLLSATKINSSDSKIINPEINEFHSLLLENHQIKYLLFNGGNAYKYFKKAFPDILKKYHFRKLYSTSLQNSKNSFLILQEWQKTIEEFLIMS